MSRTEFEMSLLERVLGVPRPVGLDEATLRRLERALHRTEPDPLFRRRLRGQVVNRYVAAREGMLREPRQRRQMGTLGRAVLYASLVLAVSVSAVGAASQESLPGDLLYGVKLQLEEVRMRIAPHSMQDDLAALALAERVEELERLADAGAWQLVPGAAARVTEAELTLLAMEPGTTATEREAAEQAIEVLEAVLVTAPAPAQDGLERALDVVGGAPAAPGRPASPLNARPSPIPRPATPQPTPNAAPSQPADQAESRSGHAPRR